MRAAAYIRVSTEEQVEGFSLAAQSRAIRAYCELQGWQLVGEYVDEGLSASKESSAQRPEFRRILAAVEAGEVGRGLGEIAPQIGPPVQACA
jgi:site-specific DNA recombinase